MNNYKKILEEIKLIIHQLVPDGKIFLFGSRANDNAQEESDWDILILTKIKYTKEMRWAIQDSLFPISLKLSAYIDITLVEEDQWNNNPGYYSLKLDLSRHKMVAI